ncbi:MAG: ATP-binding protein [Candidatus Cloacimonetes bacterium]|nr:ATP-binding protein [Candidatus Cloacimonadota bacterium]
MRKNKIPYGISNFEELKGNDYYFVDKTRYIFELEKYKAPVFLRPRRFGKTLWCSILECYYDINKKNDFDKLFGDTFIGKNPTDERNQCLILRLNFSKVSITSDLLKIEKSFNSECRNIVRFFLAYYKDYFANFTLTTENISDKLSQILSFIKENNLPKLYIIIDEYDNFSNQLILSQQTGLYENLTGNDSFFKTFFKVIKAGVEDLSIRRVYITGVLPITMDDLTSGFNIAKFITLNEQFLSMLGFTQNEVEEYLEFIFEDNNFYTSNLETIKVLLKNYYYGYKFSVTAEELYNSTIVSNFLQDFVMGNGKIPLEFIDPNLKTDVSWIRRLTLREENAKEMLEKLIFDGELSYDQNMISSSFNMNQFFEKNFYPVSLFYLGMLTFRDDYTMIFPNQTMTKIFADYFNIIEKIEVSSGYTDYFRQFIKDLDLEKLFAGYWETYVKQIPAQCFDKANENFFRTTFYELCTRYLSRNFILNVEVNYPSGRSDWELLGKYHTEYKNLKYIVEFKHFSKVKAQKLKIQELQKPFEEDVIQVQNYAADIIRDFPEYDISKFVIYTISAETFRFFKVK